MAINSVNISGNLTRDAELRHPTVLSFTVAVNERYKDSKGEWQDSAGFYPCNLYGNRAEKLAPYLTKGTKVAVSGKLHWHQWEKDGEKRSSVEITVMEVEFVAQSRTEQKPVYDEDVPF